MTAPLPAGRIRSDFKKGFISAEVAAYDECIACGGEQGARHAGKLSLEGKEHIIEEGGCGAFPLQCVT